MANESEYRAFVDTGGYPVMGFSLFAKEGVTHAFFYHQIENMTLREGRHGQYLQFTHRGKAVTLKGEGLYAIYHGIMSTTLQAVYEFGDQYRAPGADDPVVERAEVTEVPRAVEKS